MRPILAFATTTLLSVLATAAEPKKPEPPAGDAMIEKYLAAEVARISKKELDGATTREEWEKRRPRLKQEYFEMLGLWPLPEKTPLKATVTGTVEGDDIVVEKVHFQSKPGLYVTGNLFRPKKVEGKLSTVLYVCGHSGAGRHGGKVKFQDHGIWFAHNGYICLIIDTLQLGEIPGIHHGTYNLNRWWWQARGYTPAGVECWNGVRGIDYLVSRPDVDANRIAVTGISGGGAATLWITAADERVKVAVPVSGMSDLESYVTHKIINGHCDCMLMINTYQWEWTTIAGLVAPRPMLFANSDNDGIFPMDGNRRISNRLSKLYTLYDKKGNFGSYVSKGGHAYRPDLRINVFLWINKHLKNETREVKDTTEYKQFPEEQLRVFPKDEDLPKDSLNGKIDETFVPRGQPGLPEEGKFDEWKAGLVKELRAKAFLRLPKLVKAAALRKPAGDEKPELEKLETEPGIIVPLHGLGFRKPFPDPFPEKQIGISYQQRRQGGGHWNYLLDPRGAGSTAWTAKSPPNYVERSHALIGKTADERRVRDIIAAVRYLKEKSSERKEIDLIGKGHAGVLAAYAALLDPAIDSVTIIDPPASHREGPIFLNVLRVCDIPDVLGAVAPRPLTLINAKDKAFDRTVEIYKRAGAADKLKR